MKKSVFLVAMLGMVLVSGLVLISCGAKCGGSCEVYWTADGKSAGLSACGVNDCASECIVYKNAYSNKDAPGVNIHYTCDCN
jgi:hypothetical protein